MTDFRNTKAELNKNGGAHALIFDIQRNSFVDGPGIRTTVFFKGCNLRCAWCHNPESQACRRELMFYKEKCIGCGKCREVCQSGQKSCTACGACAAVCPVSAREISGVEYTLSELIRECRKDVLFYEASGGGVSFSGGECMLHIDFLRDALMACRNLGIHTAVDTAGNLPWSYFEKIMPYTSLFLYDVKCMDDALHKRFCGVSNKLILENLGKLLSAGASVWIRIPVISGVNDTVECMTELVDFIKDYPKPARIELLPYHSMGEGKYSAIGLTSPSFSAPTDERMSALREVFGAYRE